MTGRVVTASHRAAVRSPAGEVYRLLADLDSWPRIFAPFVHLERLGPAEQLGPAQGPAAEGTERIGMWSVFDDTVEHWVVRRRCDEAALRLDFWPEVPPPPVASTRRSWLVEPASAHTCVVRLEQECRVGGADPGAADEVADAMEELGRRELAAVLAAAETAALSPELLVTVEDTVPVAAGRAAVYAALHRAADWPSFLAHVARAETRDFDAGGQLLETDTVEAHGGTFTTRAARVGIAPGRIAYKQLLLPPLGASHHVRWDIEERPGGCAVTSRQTVVLRPAGVAAVLGDDADIEAARGFVRSELSGKVRLILQGVRNHLADRGEDAAPAEDAER